MLAARERSAQMSAAQLRQELEHAAKQAAEQAKSLDEVWNECFQIEGRVSSLKDELKDAQDDLAKRDFTIQSLKDQLDRAGDGSTSGVNAERLVGLVSRKAPPSPLQCLDLIEELYGDKCVVLAHALKKPVVLVSSNEGDVPFDLKHIRVIYYDVTDPFWGTKLLDKVAENILSAIKNPEEAVFKGEGS